jgi:hypothetical protein
LVVLAGGYATHALHAQDRSAAPRTDQRPASAATHHWWDPPATASQSGMQPVSASSTQPAGQPSSATFRLRRDQAGDAKPIILDADEIASWTEKNGSTEYCVFLLRGLVLAQQAIVRARFQQGVAWVDVSRYKVTGKLRMELYAEGEVRIDDGSAIRDYPRAILDITTRGEFVIHAHRAPLAKQMRADDPVVHRGRAEGIGPQSRPAAPPIQRASFDERQLILPPTLKPAAKPAPDLQPVPPTPRPMPPPASSPPLPPAQPQRSSYAPPATMERISYAAPPAEPSTGDSTNAKIDDPKSAGQVAPPARPGQAPGQPTSQPGDGPQPPTPDGPASSQPEPRAPDGSVPPSGPSQVPPGTPPIPPPSRPTPPPTRSISQGRNIHIAPRQGGSFALKREVQPNGETILIVTGGVIVQVRNAPNVGLIDMEADRVVIWTRDNGEQLATNIQQPEGYESKDLEVYLAGHVILRQAPIINPKGEQRSISANEVYYDVNRNVAIAHDARLELQINNPLLATQTTGLRDPIIATAQELRQTSINTFELVKTEVFSSRLPSDPGLKVYMREAAIEDRTVPMKNLYGAPVMDRRTGQPVLVRDTRLTGDDTFFELEDIPFLYLPHVSTSLQEPLGPIQDFNFGYNHIYGIQLGVSLNLYELLGIQQRPGTRFLLNLNYLSYRGPGAGILYNYGGTDLFGVPTKYQGMTRAYGMYDRNFDNLGGARPVNNFDPPNFRGWFLNRTTVEDMPYGFSSLIQLSPISDRNFVEQYYKRVWDLDPNLDTFLYLKQQQDNWAWSAVVQPRLRNWVLESQNLPRLDGWLIGQDFFQIVTYTTHVNAEYAALRISNDPLPQISVTDMNNTTFRGSWMQEAQVPFYLGPIKFLPYGRAELTEYSRDLTGNTIGRAWGAAGLRASIPFTHLYPSIQSELWNVNGVNHKATFSANYVYAYTNQPYTRFPQLDRLNDEATNQALRDIRPYQMLFNPNGVFDNHGLSLVFSPYFNTPQTYAIRRLLWDRIDTLSTIEELQLQLSQRLQTKRGFPGNQHVVDWMMLDLSGSFFPAQNRDNFGHPWAFLQYNYLWNIGDRTAFESTGWTDPFPGGVKVWTIGGYFNRPDRTQYYLGFRLIDPIQVRAVTAAMTYIFSPKYAATVSSTYDFGTSEAIGNSLMFTRMGSDIQVSLGFSYNALQNNFGVLFNIVPNLLPTNRAFGPMSSGGAGSMTGVLK